MSKKHSKNKPPLPGPKEPTTEEPVGTLFLFTQYCILLIGLFALVLSLFLSI